MYRKWFEVEKTTGMKITGTRQGCEYDGKTLVLITIFLHGDVVIGEYRHEETEN